MVISTHISFFLLEEIVFFMHAFASYLFLIINKPTFNSQNETTIRQETCYGAKSFFLVGIHDLDFDLARGSSSDGFHSVIVILYRVVTQDSIESGKELMD
jgi:hypothetical protein